MSYETLNAIQIVDMDIETLVSCFTLTQSSVVQKQFQPNEIAGNETKPAVESLRPAIPEAL